MLKIWTTLAFIWLSGSYSVAQIKNASAESLRQGLLKSIKNPTRREKLLKHFQERVRAARLSDQLDPSKIVLVGSGPHTLIYINGLLQASAHPETLAKRIVVLEAQGNLGGNFWKGQWYLNSKVFDGGIETNELPKALFQVADFVPADRFPMAHDMGDAVALNFLALQKQGVQFLTNVKLQDFDLIDAHHVRISLETKDGKTKKQIVSFLGLGTGLGSPSLGRIENPETQKYLQLQTSQNTDLLKFQKGVMDSHVWLISLHTMPAPQFESLVKNQDIAIIGYRHTATVAAESLLGRVPDRNQKTFQRTAERVTMYGMKVKTGAEFLEAARLGGTEDASPGYAARNEALGLPQAIDSGFVVGVPFYVEKMSPAEDGSVVITYNENGVIKEKKHKIVILAVGQNNFVMNQGHARPDFKVEFKPLITELGGVPRESGKQVIAISENKSIEVAPVVVYGPAASQKIESDFLNQSIVRGRNSLDVQKRLTFATAERNARDFSALGGSGHLGIRCEWMF